MTKIPVLARRAVAPTEFVDFWQPLYRYPSEPLYDDNIGERLTADRIRVLFEWKNGGRLSAAKHASVERNFVERRSELEEINHDLPHAEFLARFSQGGAIWRLFWLYIWQPERYPIFDQHVYRAMRWIQTGTPEEIPSVDARKLTAYDEFLGFFRESFGDCKPRAADRALFACGKFLKPFVGTEARFVDVTPSV
jgi:hypothetical protein